MWLVCVFVHACRLAGALKALDKLAADDKTTGSAAAAKEVAELRAALMGQAGWAHWQAHERALMRVKFPAALPPLL